MTLDKLQRVAIARIFSDLVEADYIIDDSEIEYFNNLISNACYKISESMLVDAKSRTFAWAVNTLQQLHDEDKNEIKDRMHKLALYDGGCVPQEALQIMAVTYALDGRAEVLSVPSVPNEVEAMKAIYVENEDSTPEDDYIRKNFRAIDNEFHIAGFNFVYIPHFAYDYCQMDSQYLRNVISYMVPSWDEERISCAQDMLCSLTTSRFCHELLYRKIGLNILGTRPAILFKIGESKVSDRFEGDDAERKLYSNYLKVNIDGNILSLVIELMDTYRRMVSNISTIEVRPPAHKFIYSGFHKSLFDLIVFGKEKKDYRLLINLADRNKPTVSFVPLNGSGEPVVPHKMSPMAATLYVLMVQESLTGKGLDWRENISHETKAAIMQHYNAIYQKVSNRECPTEYKDLTLISRIKKELKSLESSVGNMSLFMPEQVTHGRESIYYVPASADLVEVIS